MGIPNARISGGVGYPECPYFGRLGVSRMPVEKCPESYKPVEIGDLGPCGAWVGGGYTEVQPPGKAADGPLRGRKGETSGLADLD